MMAMSSDVAAVSAPPPPEEPLVYPITFLGRAEEDIQSSPGNIAAASSSGLDHISIFSALHWLLPIYELADWLPKVALEYKKKKEGEDNTNNTTTTTESCSASAEATDVSVDIDAIPYEDVRVALRLLPLFQKFFVEGSKIIPQHTDLYYYIESFTLPTPKGPKVITRAKVEGDYRATHQPSHAPSTPGAAGATTKTTITNSTAYFSLLPGHNQFLLYYEGAEKLRHFTYLQLDQLRFVWVAAKELLEEKKVYHLSDGSITGLAKRDLKKNNASSPFCRVTSTQAVAAAESAGSNTAAGGGAVVGRGGGNARLHQGTSGNVITAPNKETLEEKKRMQEMRFLREELEQECQRRWPYTPVAKSCIFTVEEKIEAELPAEALGQLGLIGANNAKNSKNGNRRGPRFYLATVELPLLNKKGGTARFKAPRWWNNRRDAESAAAEATLMALRTMKS